jgi:flagellar hook-associated protein 3 FlgL
MRVTLGMITDGVRINLQRNAEELLQSQNQASSGKRIQRPSDDVPGTGRAMSLRATLSSTDQYDRNSGIAKNLLTATSGALQTMDDDLQDAYVKAAQAANGAQTPEALSAIATQLTEIEKNLQGAANTQYLNRYIFSGSLSSTQPVVPNAGVGSPYVFQGDNSDFDIQVAPATSITANITADKVLNIGGAANPDKPDVFTTLEAIRQKVLAGDVDGVSAQLTDLKWHLNNVIGLNAQVGSRLNRLESANQSLQTSKTNVQELLSNTEDADTANSIIDLQTRQNLYQSALGVASKILNMSLADYWK